ncbi:GreA/GreB family elongation factor [Luteolibacter yonseiensis]|uniref:GreA/GreB family elongation factor n=1 Tax=Luteolibacter yonseiensis TaxID=1144680 RepID=A0A934R7G1_9BACT|nr:GreA/GreB family elongation factor [Luteolibacter yonseiensis]MBK1818427.1 GreA/GreB family elongation factor [Luteolibacter yonseiensis]
MKPLILLNEADQSCLHSIIHRNSRPPYPDPEQADRLNHLLASSRPPTAGEKLLTHVEIGDHTTLISPLDSQDYYKFRIVMPDEADIDLDHISIFTPIAAAVLGRPVGEMVEWETPIGQRRMRIIAVRKQET